MAIVTLRASSELKKQANTLFNDLGFTLSSAINLFLTQAVREYKMPFKYNIDKKESKLDSIINVSVDKELKEDAEVLFKSIGLNMSKAITIFLNKSLDFMGIPFLIKLNKPNEETILSFIEGEAMLNDPNARSYNSFDEILDLLNKEEL